MQVSLFSIGSMTERNVEVHSQFDEPATEDWKSGHDVHSEFEAVAVYFPGSH